MSEFSALFAEYLQHNSFSESVSKYGCAVRITTTPTNPRTHRKTPAMKKVKIINIIPIIKRKIPSPFAIFFTFTVGFSSLNSSSFSKKPHYFFRNGV